MATPHTISQWIKQQAASERSFANAVRRFFREQAERIADAAADVHGLTPALVPLIFNVDAEHKRFMPLVRRNISGLMVAGAVAEFQTLARRRKPRKAAEPIDPFDDDFMERFGLEPIDIAAQFNQAIPVGVRQRISQQVQQTTQQPFWKVIQDTVQADIGGIIQESLDDGVSPTEMASRIADGLGGKSTDRASRIARTETTGSLNAGHSYAISDAADGDDDGWIVGQEWLAILDDSTRETHVDANGQVVAVDELFIVGGNECEYPGDDRLPPQERIRCRCTVVAKFRDDDDDDS